MSDIFLLTFFSLFLNVQIRRLRQSKASSLPAASQAPATLTAQISALRTPRNIRTRGLTNAEHDPKIEKTARIAGVLREICEVLANHKGMSIHWIRFNRNQKIQ